MRGDFPDTHCWCRCLFDPFWNCTRPECGSASGVRAEEGSGWGPPSSAPESRVPSASCPETQQWSVMTCDRARPHRRDRLWTLDRPEAALKDNLFHLQHRCWICLSAADPSHRNPPPHPPPRMEEMCFPGFYGITVARFPPRPRLTQMTLFSPPWLPVSHYHRDNHHVHYTQGTQPPDKPFTHSNRTFVEAQIYNHSSHWDSNKFIGFMGLWSFDLFSLWYFPFSSAVIKDFHRRVWNIDSTVDTRTGSNVRAQDGGAVLFVVELWS